MVEKDAIQAIDEAVVEVNAVEGALENAKAHLREAVRRAHRQGYPKTLLAKRVGVHRNTINTWCAEETE